MAGWRVAEGLAGRRPGLGRGQANPYRHSACWRCQNNTPATAERRSIGSFRRAAALEGKAEGSAQKDSVRIHALGLVAQVFLV